MADSLGAAIVDFDRVTISSRAHRRAVVADAFVEYHGELYNFLRRSTRDDEAAEDLLQEAFVRLTREVDAGRTPEHLRGWLYRVASNLAISRGRRGSTVLGWLNRYGRAAATEYEESPETGYLRNEGASALDEALAVLSAEARTALQLSADGFNGEEIAAAIGRSNGATRTLLSRSRVKVRLELERRERAR
jgi:RNA polymerase sigma-70 factor (ECF subfamily)